MRQARIHEHISRPASTGNLKREATVFCTACGRQKSGDHIKRTRSLTQAAMKGNKHRGEMKFGQRAICPGRTAYAVMIKNWGMVQLPQVVQGTQRTLYMESYMRCMKQRDKVSQVCLRDGCQCGSPGYSG
jgi:hypothetical protein